MTLTLVLAVWVLTGEVARQAEGRGVVRGAEERDWPHPSLLGCYPWFCLQSSHESFPGLGGFWGPAGRSEAMGLALSKSKQYPR